MGNTSSTPPPLISVHACGTEILVPPGTSLDFRLPAPHAGYCGLRSYAAHAQAEPRGPVYGPVAAPYPARARTKRYARGKRDFRISEGGEGSESTELGEMLGDGEMRGEMLRKRDMSGGLHARRVKPGVSGSRYVNQLDREHSAPDGCVGLRGGQGVSMHPAVDDGGMSLPNTQHPGLSPHPPGYASRKPSPRYSQGASNPYASHPLQPPPSANSPPPNSKPPADRLSPDIQEAIHQAVLKSADFIRKSEPRPTHARTSPATLAKDKITDPSDNYWEEDFDTCVCTTRCICRKGERATGWYRGTALDQEGEEIPVRGKLETRWVLNGDLGKDCGDHSGCKKSSSSSSETEAFIAKKRKKKSSRKQDKVKADELEELKFETDKMKKNAKTEQRRRYPPSPFARDSPDFDLTGTGEQHPDPELLPRLHTMELNDDLHGVGRMGGMNGTRATQGMFDPKSTRNSHGPRMPPKRGGMQAFFEDDGFREEYEGMSASMKDPYASPGARGSKGRNRVSAQPDFKPGKGRSQTDFGFRRGDVFDSDNEPRADFCRVGRRGFDNRGAYHPRSGSGSSHSNPVARKRSGIKDIGDGNAKLYNLPKHSVGDQDEDASPRIGRAQSSPPSRRAGERNGRAAGRQAHVETDDDASY